MMIWIVWFICYLLELAYLILNSIKLLLLVKFLVSYRDHPTQGLQNGLYLNQVLVGMFKNQEREKQKYSITKKKSKNGNTGVYLNVVIVGSENEVCLFATLCEEWALEVLMLGPQSKFNLAKKTTSQFVNLAININLSFLIMYVFLPSKSVRTLWSCTQVRMESYMGMGWLFVVCWHLLLFHFSFSHSLCHTHDSFALLHFKASFPFNTTYYYNAYECPVTNLKTTTWENGTDCCSWLGVTCHPISGHVTGLDLSCSGLYGEIHPNSTLFHLSHLQSLNLANNDFYPSPLSSLFCGFVSLTHLNLSNTYFRGEIPSQISHLSKLQSLDLSLPLNSQFLLKWRESTWKRLLQNATVLRELDLAETDMSSISIRTLNMSSCFVTLTLRENWPRGNLTDDILCLPNLQHLYLSENWDLQGQLPEVSCQSI